MVGTVDLNSLSVFVVVGETASFSAAARKLGLPKSTVSRTIAALEAAMDVQLLHRTTRKVAFTTAGASLYEKVAPLIASLERTVAAVPDLADELKGRLRVTAPVDFGASMLAEIVTQFQTRYPAIELDLHLTGTMIDLVAEGFDMALRISEHRIADDSLVIRKVAPLSLMLFASPSYLQHYGTPRTPADLGRHRWIVFSTSREVLEFDGPEGSMSVRPSGRLACDDMFFMREALRHGAGIGMLPSYLARGVIDAGEVVRVLPNWHIRTGYLWLAYPVTVPLPRKVSVFKDYVVAWMAARLQDSAHAHLE